MDKQINNGQQNNVQKTKDRAARSLLRRGWPHLRFWCSLYLSYSQKTK